MGFVTLNEGLVTVEDMAFSGKSKLWRIIIPSTVVNITKKAFYGSTLSILIFKGDAPSGYAVKNADGTFDAHNPDYAVGYKIGAKGFTLPTWLGYTTFHTSYIHIDESAAMSDIISVDWDTVFKQYTERSL